MTSRDTHWHCADCERTFPDEQGAYMHAIRCGHNVGDLHWIGDACPQAEEAKK